MTQHIDKEKRKCQIFSEEERYDWEDTTSDLHIREREYKRKEKRLDLRETYHTIQKYMIIQLYNQKNYF